ncbi:hypothetical protein [Streptomyces sp. NPDC002537]
MGFTATPGVTGATVTAASYTPDETPTTESAGRILISESVQASVEPLGERPAGEAYSAKQRRAMAGRGQAMTDGSYSIRTRADLRRAIRAVGRGGADHDVIRRHIIQRATALGLVSMIPDTWNKDGSMEETFSTRLGEIREFYPDGPEGGDGFCIDAYNGPLSLTMRACGIDPAELRTITAAAMTAAVEALQAMDPDMDADIDVAGAPHAGTDGDMGTSSGESAPPVPGPLLTAEHFDAVRAAAAAGDLKPGTFITAQVVTEALAKTAPPTGGAATSLPRNSQLPPCSPRLRGPSPSPAPTQLHPAPSGEHPVGFLHEKRCLSCPQSSKRPSPPREPSPRSSLKRSTPSC